MHRHENRRPTTGRSAHHRGACVECLFECRGEHGKWRQSDLRGWIGSVGHGASSLRTAGSAPSVSGSPLL